MNVSARLPDDHPLMLAWKKWQAEADYDTARMWAEYLVIESNGPNLGAWRAKHPHLEGSLWAMFMAGWDAREKAIPAGWHGPVPPESESDGAR
jgi:hypothetical protein